MNNLAKVNFYAVGLGTLTDLATSVILAVVIARILVVPVPLGASIAIGLSCMTLGGFVAAKLSNDYKLLNATLVGVLGIFIGLLFVEMLPIWYVITSTILMPPFAYLGGLIEAKI